MEREGFADASPTTLSLPAGLLVVNLDRRPDRLAQFRHSFAVADVARQLPLHRIPAVEGKTIDTSIVLTPGAQKEMEVFRQTHVRTSHSQLTPGAVGCYLSHVKCWEFVAQQNRPWIVCEDDAVLPETFGARLPKALAAVPARRAETLVFLHILCDPALYKELKCDRVPGQSNLFRAHHFWSTACYYITPEAARALLARALPMAIQVDHAMAKWGREGVVDNYAYPMVRTSDRDTDIQAPVDLTAATRSAP